VVWLAEQLAGRGQALEPGDLVITGGLTSAHPLEPGHSISASFGDGRLLALGLTCADAWTVPVTEAGLAGGLLPHADKSSATPSAASGCRPKVFTRASPIVRPASIATGRGAAS
jgi:hypothetical protein